jgi:hypothetical protein
MPKTEAEIQLKAGGVLRIRHLNENPSWVTGAVLVHNGNEYAIEADALLSVVKSRATRKVNAIERDLARHASFQAGMPRQVTDDVKPAGCLL